MSDDLSSVSHFGRRAADQREKLMSKTGSTPRVGRTLLALALSTIFALLFVTVGTSPTEAALVCTNDLQGVDDQPGQKDLTQFCRGLSSDIPSLSCTGVDAFTITWN
jgi:hypothetical protein